MSGLAGLTGMSPAVFTDGVSVLALQARGAVDASHFLDINCLYFVIIFRKGHKQQSHDSLSSPCCANIISLRPNSARLMFLMQKSARPLEVLRGFSLGEDSSSELSLHTATQKSGNVYKNNQLMQYNVQKQTVEV